MYEGLDTVVLYNELAYEDLLPLRWSPLAQNQVDSVFLASCAERNLKLLQAIAALEEHGQPEKTDEHAPYHADIVRLDMKINLLLELVGQILAANQARPEKCSVRFNAHGAAWRHFEPAPAVGGSGVLEIYLRDSIVEPLRLVGQISAVQDGLAKANFLNPGEAVANLIEKLAFRRHRRQVAGARQPKK